MKRTTLLNIVALFALGSLAALAMAPTHLWGTLVLALSALYFILAQCKSLRLAALYGWVFSFGYFLFSLNWIGNALLVEGNPYQWAWPLAVSTLPALLAIFTALACALAYRFADLKKASGFFSFCAFIILFEWLRGHAFTGFPWNLYGYTWGETLPIAQIVWLSDIYGLSYLTILWGALPGFLMLHRKNLKPYIPLTLIVVLSFGATYFYGAQRLKNARTDYHENIELRIVQPNIKQSEKWDRSKMMAHFQKQIEFSRADSLSDKITYIIWPETALSPWFLSDDISRAQITEMLRSYEKEAYLFTGALRQNREGQYFNSLIMIDPEGEITNIYNKSHLVPFGEYIPFQQWIPLKPITQFTGFQKGAGPQTYQTPQGLSYLPLICYEAIFTGKAQQASKRPDFMINVTNDAWYGQSAGPYQHFIQTKFRAIENGTQLVRASNAGISASISPYGIVEARSELFETSSKSIGIYKNLTSNGLSHHIKLTIALILLIVSTSLGYIKKKKAWKPN